MEFRHTLMVKNLTAETLTWTAIGMLKSADSDGPALKKRSGWAGSSLRRSGQALAEISRTFYETWK